MRARKNCFTDPTRAHVLITVLHIFTNRAVSQLTNLASSFPTRKLRLNGVISVFRASRITCLSKLLALQPFPTRGILSRKLFSRETRLFVRATSPTLISTSLLPKLIVTPITLASFRMEVMSKIRVLFLPRPSRIQKELMSCPAQPLSLMDPTIPFPAIFTWNFRQQLCRRKPNPSFITFSRQQDRPSLCLSVGFPFLHPSLSRTSRLLVIKMSAIMRVTLVAEHCSHMIR